jgi:hypothetical protein
MPPGTTNDAIELRVDEIAQLFHTLDPFPFRERDLDREAEEFIVGWARELPTDQPIRIIVHFPESDVQSKAAQDLAEAFRRYFSHRAAILQGELSRDVRYSVAIRVPAQPVDATQALNLSAGVSNCKVSRGRSFSWRATLFR